MRNFLDPMLTHHAVVGATPDVTTTIRFDVSAVHPFDGLKIALEQILLGFYIGQTVNNPHIAHSIVLTGLECARSLPAELHAIEDTTIAGIYAELVKPFFHVELIRDNPYHAIVHMVGEVASAMRKIPPAALMGIFTEPPRREYIHRPYLPTITKDLLMIAIDLVYRWHDKEQYPEGKLYDARLYIPSLQVQQNYNPTISAQKNQDYQIVCTLMPRRTQGYMFKSRAGGSPLTEESHGSPFIDGVYDSSGASFLASYDLRDYSVDDLIGILASYSVDHSLYAMTALPVGGFATITGACFDLVSGSNFLCNSAASGSRAEACCERFFTTVRYMVENGRLRGVQEKGLFGELLRRLGADSAVVSYFLKPITTVTAAEAFAFRNSVYAGFVDDRFAGMEAAEDEDPTAVAEDPAAEPADAMGDQGTVTDPTATPQMDPMGGTSEDEKKEDSNAKPSIDPNKMLLEIAKKTEPMSDYIYRDMIARRISNILKNPPENAMPNDLLMLKRWRSRWLYLVSTPCLRDFLTRVSLRLSNP